MDTAEIVAQLEEQLENVKKAIAALQGGTRRYGKGKSQSGTVQWPQTPHVKLPLARRFLTPLKPAGQGGRKQKRKRSLGIGRLSRRTPDAVWSHKILGIFRHSRP